MKKLIIAVDFDGTIVKAEPDLSIKELLPKAKEVLDWLNSLGHTIVVWTCRSGDKLAQAVAFLKENDIPYHFINQNVPDIEFQTSAKIFYDILIDDKSVSSYQKIDWVAIKQQLEGIFNKRENKLCELLCSLNTL